MINTEEKSKSRFFLGVIALTVGNLFVKLVGLILKVPLHDILGDGGMTFYNNAYDIYAWLFTIATTGLPTAVAMLVSWDRAKGNTKEITKIFRVTTALFLIIGTAGMSVMLFGAKLFEKAYEIDNLSYCVMAVGPTLFFICLASAFRGYFQGYQNMLPTAISEIIEALGKLIIGLLLANYAVSKGYPIHIVAAYAALGLTIGVAAGMVFLWISKILFRPEKYDTEYSGLSEEAPEVRTSGKLMLILLGIAVPITISSSVQSFAAVVDGIVLSRRLQSVGFSQEAAKAMIGNYKTLASPLVNLPTALIPPITASIIPLISSSIASGNKAKTKNAMNGGLLLTMIIELPCALGLSVLSEPIIKTIFGDNASSETAAPLLSVLALSVFSVSIIGLTCSFLQAYKYQWKPMISMLAGAIVKTGLLYILVGIPKINIYGSPISSFIGGLTISALNLYFIKKYIGFFPDFVKMLLRPFAASVVCAATAGVCYRLFVGFINFRIAVVGAILVAMVVYFFVIFLIKAVTREDILLLPKGQKICSLLEKIHLIK